MDDKDSLDVAYTDPRVPGSFGGVQILKRYSDRSEREVRKFLVGSDAYTLHKPRRIRFPRRKTYSKGIADLYNNNNNNNNTLIYIAPACRMTSEALADSSSRATECLTEK